VSELPLSHHSNGAPARPDLAPPRVGSAIKRLRLQRDMSLQKLPKASHVSAAMLSQIERDLANPSLRTLTRIRHALRVPLSALFEGDAAASGPDPDFVRRAGRRPKLDLGPRHVVKELLSSSAAQGLQFMILDVPPRGGSGEQTLSYPSEKAGLVIEGEFLLIVEEVEVYLREGDSFQFDGGKPHRFVNPADRMARVLWIIGQTLPARHL
jgi:transcriptional regulator with XRE-family HTH domain